MRVVDATVTSRGQVTIRIEVRRHLGLTKRARVTFVIDEDGVRLVPARHTPETALGAVPAIPGLSTDFDREIEEAKEDEADRMMGRPGRP